MACSLHVGLGLRCGAHARAGAPRSGAPGPALRHAARAPLRQRRPTLQPFYASSEERPRMFVPADGMGGERPESKGAAALSRLFTFVAIRIVQAQMEGLGNDGGFAPQATGMSGDVESPGYDALRRAMSETPLGDGDTWIEALMQRDAALALRVMSVREAYTKDFDWALLAGLTQRRVAEGNTRLMRAHVERSAGDRGAAAPPPPQ